MENACGILKEWEDEVNKEFRDLIFKNLNDAFNEGTENSGGIELLEEGLDRAWKVVSMLTNRFSSGNLESRSVKRSRFAKKLELNIENMMSESSIFKEIREVYNGLNDKWKQNCLLCFSVFPQNAVIKKKALVHCWVGEGFLCNTSREKNTAEKKGNDLFQEFIASGQGRNQGEIWGDQSKEKKNGGGTRIKKNIYLQPKYFFFLELGGIMATTGPP
jgi:hypothetical protein